MSFMGVIFWVLVTLKLVGLINLSWWYVTSPLWFIVCSVLIIAYVKPNRRKPTR